MADYTISLKNEKLVLYNRLSKLIILIFLILFCYLAFFSDFKAIGIKATGTIILLAIGFALQYYFRNTKYKIGHRPFFLVIALGWITLEYYWLAFITLVFDTFSIFSTRQLNVIVAKDLIRYPSFPSKEIEWKDLNQVILKDGLLTIDLKSNKLIQQPIDELKTAVDEKEFNDFCRQQLNK